jgi:hypothetical protein
MLAIAVLYFGWAFLAADFFQHDPDAPAAETDFWSNSIAQLANLPKVLGYGFANRLWLIGLFVVAEVGVFILWRVMARLDKELWR